jgi:hypothetical protein
MRRRSFGKVSRELSLGNRMARSARMTKKYRQKVLASRSSSYGLEWDTRKYMAGGYRAYGSVRRLSRQKANS